LRRTEADPILALSGSWQIGKKDVQTERGNNSTSKISNNFHSADKTEDNVPVVKLKRNMGKEIFFLHP
jgi:hypothetical protein